MPIDNAVIDTKLPPWLDELDLSGGWNAFILGIEKKLDLDMADAAEQDTSSNRSNISTIVGYEFDLLLYKSDSFNGHTIDGEAYRLKVSPDPAKFDLERYTGGVKGFEYDAEENQIMIIVDEIRAIYRILSVFTGREFRDILGLYYDGQQENQSKFEAYSTVYEKIKDLVPSEIIKRFTAAKEPIEANEEYIQKHPWNLASKAGIIFSALVIVAAIYIFSRDGIKHSGYNQPAPQLTPKIYNPQHIVEPLGRFQPITFYPSISAVYDEIDALRRTSMNYSIDEFASRYRELSARAGLVPDAERKGLDGALADLVRYNQALRGISIDEINRRINQPWRR